MTEHGAHQAQPVGVPGADERDVLIVDDDPPIRTLLRQVFRRIGLSSREARDGVEALSCIDETAPHLMMLDLMMPRMNGWQVLEHLREKGMLDKIPVVVLTAVGAHRTESLKEFGVRAILSKPFEIQDLIRTVQHILEEP
ncbi:MAG TPA: response regulator [Thermoanaerobaculia bacterium]|nr:response regulator [Thermoanaerobaculia bacterium]